MRFPAAVLGCALPGGALQKEVITSLAMSIIAASSARVPIAAAAWAGPTS